MTLRERLATNEPPTLTIIPGRPGVYVAQRHGGGYHVLQNVGTPFLMCTTCKAAEHGRDCWAVELAARQSQTLIQQAKETNMAETTTAMAIAERRETVVKATETRLAVAAHLAGWTDLVTLGNAHLKTGLAPKGFDTPEKCALALLKAMELGVPLTTAYEFFYIANGRVGVMAQMVRALVEHKLQGDGYIHVESSSAMGATCVGYRHGRKPVRVTFTIEDAKRAGLIQKNSNWGLYPEDHCVAKASARVGRRMFADVLGGMAVFDRGEVIDSMDFSEEEGAGGGTIEVLEGEFRPVESEPEPARTVDRQTGEIFEPHAETGPGPNVPGAFVEELQAAMRARGAKPTTVGAFLGIEAKRWGDLYEPALAWCNKNDLPAIELVTEAINKALAADAPDAVAEGEPALPFD